MVEKIKKPCPFGTRGGMKGLDAAPAVHGGVGHCIRQLVGGAEVVARDSIVMVSVQFGFSTKHHVGFSTKYQCSLASAQSINDARNVFNLTISKTVAWECCFAVVRAAESSGHLQQQYAQCHVVGR
jgi:hypothetical protein